MLKPFTEWAEVIAHVEQGKLLYYAPTREAGPCPAIATLRKTTPDGPRKIWLRCPDSFMTHPYKSTIADEAFIDKLYRWEPNKAATR